MELTGLFNDLGSLAAVLVFILAMTKLVLPLAEKISGSLSEMALATKTTGESLDSLVGKLDALQRSLDSVCQQMTTIGEDTVSLRKAGASLEDRVYQTETRLDRLEAKCGG